MQKTQIIFLHGPSSSGKSTTAKALQAMAEIPFWHISIDHLRDSGVLPQDRLNSQDFHWSDMRKPFFDGFHASLAAYAHAGNNLILEHILDDPDWVPALKNLLAPFDVFFVGLHCPLTLLNQREVDRGDRPLGSAAQDFETVHKGRRYDLEIQGEAAPSHNAADILRAWRSGHRCSEFASG